MVLDQKINAPPIREVFKLKRAEWHSKTAYEKWCCLYSIGRVSLDVLGFPVYHEQMVFRWYTWVFFVYLAIDTLGVLYTGYSYIFLGEFSEFLPCTILFAGPLVCVRINSHQLINVLCLKTLLKPNIFRVHQWAFKQQRRRDVPYSIL